MPQIPFPLTAKSPDELRQQVWELMRQLFEDRIGGLEIGDVFQDSGDVLTLRISSTGGIQKTSNTLALKLRDSTQLAASTDGLYLIPGGIKLDDLGTPDDNTDLNASTSAHGLLPKLSNVATQFLNGVGAWASASTSAKVGAFTRDTSTASGIQTITGVGFQPVVIILFAVVNDTAEASVGFYDGAASGNCIHNNHTVTADTWSYQTRVIYLLQGSGISYTGFGYSLDADGFKIDWVKAGAKTGTANIIYLALG